MTRNPGCGAILYLKPGSSCRIGDSFADTGPWNLSGIMTINPAQLALVGQRLLAIFLQFTARNPHGMSV
ncbi:hypothetical protein M413DRAFT_448392 [Hebeloma cylindrosporum]|uniref:Uncharacterized protein n=1 Tax=Hebeloma cylindrosporum TaxID=76867 RepID=A0A0C3C015_HEBCY|nr:hypothetical protein M413DRAFT_448392 [Hebeloma cylindrosporum h7]